MIRYVPSFILHQFDQDTFSGSLPGYVLLYDVADFTRTCQVMRRQGKRGAEELTRFLGEALGQPIREVEAHGGFVSVFAGDAFCAVFPQGNPQSVMTAVSRIVGRDSGAFITEFGEFAMQARLTVCHGRLDWRIFTNPHQCEYAFYGPAMTELAVLSAFKEPLLFSPAAARELGQQHFIAVEQGFVPSGVSFAAEPVRLDYPHRPETTRRFIHARVADETPQNEIRDAAYCFIDLTRVAEPEDTLAGLHRLLDEYGGLLNKLDATDKGLVAFAVFGLPRSQGQTLERICGFALEVARQLPELSLGIACGSVYAGYVGGGNTREYTAMGDAVNLAARLMSKALPGEVLCDTYIWQELNSRYEFNYLGALSLRGFVAPVNYYKLARMLPAAGWRHRSRVVGREDEIETLCAAVNSALERGRNAVAYVSGEAGVGKSRLIEEVLTRFPDDRFFKCALACNPILRKPLDAVKRIVQAYFYHNPAIPEETGRAMFQGLWGSLAGGDPELMRIESMIGYLMDYEWEGSVWNVLPDHEKPMQLINAFGLFISKAARRKPMLLHIDDGQWLDDLSREYFVALSRSGAGPVMILAACRYLEDGERVDFALESHEKTALDLAPLPAEGNRRLIRAVLRIDHVPAETLAFIQHRSMGNPLFTEQLSAFLLDNGNIDAAGRLSGDLENISTFGISDIISSRLDRLSERVRECVGNASVLGLEFNVRVLARMLGASIDDELDSARANMIWKDLDEIRYIFSHVLIKDTAYQRILSKRLRQLHHIAAEAMIDLYAGSLDANAAAIAMHFDLAGDWQAAAEWFTRAGDYEKEALHYNEALRLHHRALELYREHCGPRSLEVAAVLHHLGVVQDLRGDYEQARQQYTQALDIRRELLPPDHPDLAACHNGIGVICNRLGDYDAALRNIEKALDIRQRAFGELHPDTATSLNDLAATCNRLGEYDKALAQHQRSLAIWRQLPGDQRLDIASTLNNIGMVYDNIGGYDQALDYHLRALDMLREVLGEHHPRTATSLNNIGVVYERKGDYARALEFNEKALAIWRKTLGEHHPDTAVSLNGIGLVCNRMGNYPKALESHQQALAIWREALGEHHPDTSGSLNNIGMVYDNMGEYDKALEYYEQALANFRLTLGERHYSTAVTLNNIGMVYKNKGDWAKALEYLEQAVAILREALGGRHPSTAHGLNNMGTVYVGMGERLKALECFEQSLDINRETLGNGHPNTQRSLSLLAETNEQLGRTAAAADYLAQLEAAQHPQ